MTHRIAIALLIGACGLAGASALAQSEPSSRQPALPPKVSKKIVARPDTIRTTLVNGLRVVIVPDHLAPVATSIVTYRVGGRDTPPDRPGLAHATEHMMFQGSPGVSRDQNLALIAALGGAANAQTSTSFTQYYATVPAQYLDVLLHLQANHMRGANNTAKRWQTERGAIKNEVSGDLSDPSFRAQTWMRSKLLAGTPSADSPLGTAKGFDATTAKRIAAFHDAWYAPNNATLVVVGDIDPKSVLATVKTRFGAIARRAIAAHPKGKLAKLEPATQQFVTDAGTGSINVGYRAPGENEPKAKAALWLLVAILDDQTGPLTGQLVVTGDALSAGASTNIYPTAGTLTVSAAFKRGQNAKQLAQQVRDLLRDFARRGVSAEALAAAKRKEITTHATQLDSIPGLAAAWATELVTVGETPDEELASIQAVSRDQINQLARRILATDQHVTAVLSPAGSGRAQSVAQANDSQKDTLGADHPPQVVLPDWAAAKLAGLDIPQQTVHPIASNLKNGLKLVVIPSPDVHAVHVLGAVLSDGHTQTPKGQMGVSGLVNRLMSFGTTEHDRLAFRKAVNDIGARLSVGYGFAMAVMPDELGAGLKLLAEGERHPAFPKRLFEIFQHNYAAALTGVLASPGFKSGQVMKQSLLPPGDPIRRHITVKSLKSISYKDLKAYYKQTFRPDLATLVVVGNVDPARIKTMVVNNFGDWHAKGPRPTIFPGPIPNNKPSRHHVPDNSRSQDAVSQSEVVGLKHTDDDFLALELANQVLSGGSLDGRLYRALRLKRGLVYSVGSGFSAARYRTSFGVSYASAPKDVDKAGRLIARQIDKLRREPLSTDELHRAKASVLRNLALSEYSAGAIGQAIGTRALRGLALDYPYRRAAKIPGITPKQIQAAFKKWIRPNGFVSVVLGPKPGSDSR